MVELSVSGLGIDRNTQSPVVILKEKDGSQVLPIWIGPNEASAIAMELAGVKFSRPLTHDLLKNVVVGLHGELSRVMITELKNNTYYAQIILQLGAETISIDARPSDSIALALRLQAPIFAPEDLLDNAPTPEIEEAESSDVGTESLKEYLKRLSPEDFGKFNL